MLGVESKPSNDNDTFKTQPHDKALDKLGYRGLFGSGLGTGLGPVFGTSLSANLSASLGVNFSTGLGNNYSNNDRGTTREGHISNFSLDRVGERIPSSGMGRGINGGSSAPSEGNGGRKESGVELVKPSLVYDIASLILYRCQALPIRLKIALDRLFSVLTHEDVLQVLHGFGWTYEDYSRGYMLQDHNGATLHKWNMVTAEEEAILLQQFLRFGETKNIVQQLMHQDSAAARLDRVARDIREARDLRDCRDRDGRDRDRDRDYRERESREMRDHHREHREHRDHHREHSRDYRENRDDFSKNFPHHHHQKHLSSHHHHPQTPFPLPLQFTDPNKPLDPEQLKKLLERNMLFNPFMRGTGDPSSLLRPPHPANPHNLPPTSPLSNLLAVNPSLASSLLANPQLASSLSMLRLPVPPVSLPNLSPSNGALPANFGGSTSPMGGSPLNRLQSMQPFDFRKERKSPSPAPRTTASDIPMSICGGRPTSAAATSPNSITSGGSIGGGTSPSSTITPLGASAQPSVDIAVAHDRIDHLSEDDESSSTSSVALNLSTTTTTTTSPVGTPVGAGPCAGGIPSMPPKSTTPTGGGPPTPPKRSWNPINMGTSLINPVTGKKRVQCNVCLKTFCDKGALKIHFSAVHLREMHKCTVEGCNMMFSSRRSRNRHSANPNPKLHTPHVRRKISPHDGRTSGSHPVMLPHAFQQQLSQSLQPPAGFPHLGGFPGQFGGINPLTGLPFIPHSASATADLHKQALELQRQNLEMHALSKNSMDLSMRGGEEGHWKYGSNPTSTSSFLEDGCYSELSKSVNNYESKKHGDDTGTYTIDDDDSMSIDAQSFKGDGVVSSPSANKRKRKSQNPTKFAFRLEDDDLISTDDDDDDDNDDELDDLDAKDSEDDKNEDKELDAMSDDDDETNNELKNGMDIRKSEENKTDNESENKKVSSSGYTEQSDLSNALRHLEDLSKGNFNHLVGGLPSNGSNLHCSTPITQTGNGVSSSSPKHNDRDSDRESDADSHNEELENSLHYFEGFLSNVDVPLDKENPRRCIACGKMFQNHFGVKIHYQNVHLKLMHKCTVEGCNAAFPSKRSRDRHASNLNLHRKLLSTSENSSQGGFPLGFPGLGSINSTLNPEILARLYSDPASFSLEALKAQLPTSIADSIFNSERGPFNTSPSLTTSSASSPFFLHNLLPHLTSNNNVKGNEKSRTPSPQSTTPNVPSTTSSSFGNSTAAAPVSMDTSEIRRKSLSPKPSPNEREISKSPIEMVAETNLPMESLEQNQGRENNSIDDTKWIYKLEDDLPSPDREGNMPCRFCYQTFEDGEALKIHYDTIHLKDLFRCTVEGCFKVFSSRRKRNSHELNYHSSSETRYET